MIKLRGHVIIETDKAILFEITEDIHLHLQGRMEWFPKSHIQLPKKLYGKEISIYVQNWLYDDKIRIDEMTM